VSRPAGWSATGLGLWLVLAVCAQAGGPEPESATTSTAGRYVNRLRINGSINPAAADFIHDGIARSVAEGAAALVIELDTPGGLLTSTRSIVQDLLGAHVPVIVYVAPSGAGAASAGVFITLAAHVAAMAPGTNIGASTPVEGGGGDVKGDIGRKVKSFTASFAKAIAEQRGRNVEWAVRAVRHATSATDREALGLGVVDLVATDLPDLFRQATGRQVTIDGVPRKLDLTGVTVVGLEMRLRQRVLNRLADPNVAYLLMLAGLLGLYLELSHPGLLFPGVTGGICLLLAMASFQVLPINIAGLALILLGIALLVAELFLPSFGIVGVGGLVSFVLGSLFLFDSAEPDLVVDRRLIGSAAASVGLVMLAIATLVVRTIRRQPVTGREGLIGELCEVRSRVAPLGTVFLHGELWQAESREPIEPGSRARVVSIRGLTLEVAPEPPTDGRTG
jgi:membrane-bound serine protease (ClpP class)